MGAMLRALRWGGWVGLLTALTAASACDAFEAPAHWLVATPLGSGGKGGSGGTSSGSGNGGHIGTDLGIIIEVPPEEPASCSAECRRCEGKVFLYGGPEPRFLGECCLVTARIICSHACDPTVGCVGEAGGSSGGSPGGQGEAGSGNVAGASGAGYGGTDGQ